MVMFVALTLDVISVKLKFKSLKEPVGVVVTGTSDNAFVTAYSRDPLIVNLCQRACEKGTTWHFLGSVTMTTRMDANNRPSTSLFMIIRKIVESESIEKILDDGVSGMKQKRTVVMDTLKLEDEKFFVGALYKAMYSGDVIVDYGRSGYDGAQAYNEFFVDWTAAEFLKLSEIMGKMDSAYFIRGPAVLRERLSLEKQRAIRDRGTVSQIENPSLGGFGLQNDYKTITNHNDVIPTDDDDYTTTTDNNDYYESMDEDKLERGAKRSATPPEKLQNASKKIKKSSSRPLTTLSK
ncbi:hypothetical protein G6F38_008506 [Rhizopus arrhizus]|nr:hypothetical protein G6F38_008506 [Rhizopus arrhizus]